RQADAGKFPPPVPATHQDDHDQQAGRPEYAAPGEQGETVERDQPGEIAGEAPGDGRERDEQDAELIVAVGLQGGPSGADRVNLPKDSIRLSHPSHRFRIYTDFRRLTA